MKPQNSSRHFFRRIAVRPTVTRGLMFCWLVGFAALLSSSVAAQSNPAGAIGINPGDNIQSIVNSNPAGSTFLLRTGYHRLQTIIPRDGDTFIGEDGAVLSGARILTDFSREGNYWVATNQTQENRQAGECDGSAPRCRYSEDLYFDDQPLKHASSLGNVGPGSFYFDYGANKIYFADDPTNHVVEASVNGDGAFNGSAANVTIENLTIEKYAVSAQRAAIRGDNTYNWAVRSNVIRLNHGGGIRMGDAMQIVNNRIVQNGQIGIGGIGDNVLVQDNQIAYNNYAGFASGWEAGGTKFVDTRNLVVRNNYVHDNIGPGLWTDIDNIDVLIENNIVVDNYSMGIFHEISYAAIIRNNVVMYNNARPTSWVYGAQILISSSSDTDVYGNRVVISEVGGNGITVVQQSRGTGSYGPRVSLNNHVYENTIVHLAADGQNGLATDMNVDGSFWTSSSFNNNTYYLPFEGYAAWTWYHNRHTFSSLQQVGQESAGMLVNEAPENIRAVPTWMPGDTATASTSTMLLGVQQAPPLVFNPYEQDAPIADAAVLEGSIGLEGRTTEGLQALYVFNHGIGDVIRDQSGSDEPLDLYITDPGAVTWTDNMLRVNRSVLIHTLGAAARLNEAIKSSGAFTIEAWIDPATTQQSGPARVLTLSDSTLTRNFTLGQDMLDGRGVFDIRLRTTQSDENGDTNLQSRGRSLYDGLMQVILIHDAQGGTTLYINNEVVAQGIVDGSLDVWHEDYSLALANEVSGDRPWLGDYYLVAIYDRALNAEQVAQNYNIGLSEVVSLPDRRVEIGTVTADVNINVRGEPNGGVISILDPGAKVLIVGANEDESWMQVELSDGQQGWIASFLLSVEEGSVTDLE